MDKKNPRYQTALHKFLDVLFKQDTQLALIGLPVPAILIRHRQQFLMRPDAAEWSWYVGKGYQLWDTHEAKNIFVLARDEDEAFDKFYRVAGKKQELDNVNELPNGDFIEYDPEVDDDDVEISIEFTWHSYFQPTPFDFIKELWDESQAT